MEALAHSRSSCSRSLSLGAAGCSARVLISIFRPLTASLIEFNCSLLMSRPTRATGAIILMMLMASAAHASSDAEQNHTVHCGVEGEVLPDSESWNPANWERHQTVWVVTGILTLICFVMTAHLIYKHCRHFSKPVQQRSIIRILLMCPIYSIDSWFALRYYRYSIYWNTARDCYEALVILEFVHLLEAYLGGEQKAVEMFSKKTVKLMFPLNCFTCGPTKRFYRMCKYGALQYVVIRVIFTFISVITFYYEVLCPGAGFDPRYAFLWVSLINLTSVTIAMYVLVEIYHEGAEELAPFKPIPKFLSIKFVIFLTFWQLIIIAGCAKFGKLDQYTTRYYNKDQISESIQNVCICVEMVLACIAHVYAFEWQIYELKPGQKVKHSLYNNLCGAVWFCFNPGTLLSKLPVVFAHIWGRLCCSAQVINCSH